jgi:hypothetical protein
VSARLRRATMADGSADIALRDGMNLVLADQRARAAFVDAWRATLEGYDGGLSVRAVVGGKLTDVTPEVVAAGVFGDSDTLVISRGDLPATGSAAHHDAVAERERLERRRESLTVQLGEAEAAVASASEKHAQATAGLERREEAARTTLAAVDGAPGAVVAPELEAMRDRLDRLDRTIESARLVEARLEVELEFDRLNRHVRQPALTRAELNEVEEVISRRRSLVAEMIQFELVDGPAVQGMQRALGAVTADNSVDPLASQLANRWQELVSRKGSRTDQGLIQAVNSAQQRLGMARAEFERIRTEGTQSGGGGGLSVIEQALHMVLDEQTDAAAVKLKREMLDGPGPLMEVDGWHQQRGPAPSQRLDQARVEVERIQVELDQLLQQQRVSNTVDLDQVEAMLRADITQYLGRDVGDNAARELTKVRVIPAMQKALATSVHTRLREASTEKEALHERYEKLDRFRVANSARMAGARSAAMRAVADVEAHRRETARVVETLESAKATRIAREQDLVAVDAQLDQIPPSDIVGSENPLDRVRSMVLARLDPVDAPVLFDNTFAGLEAIDRWEMMTWLNEQAAGKQIVYIGEGSDLSDWAANVERVTVGRF